MASGSTAGRKRIPLSAGVTPKRRSENSKGEPPRKMRPAPRSATREDDVTLTDELGRSALHVAAMRGDVQRMRELLARGADTRLRDKFGSTPLHRALIWGKEEAAELLAESDAGNDIEDEDGRTPLHVAATQGHVGVTRRLVAGGARTRVRDVCGRTPLHWALRCGDRVAAELIAGADGGVELRDCQGRTPLHYAAGRRYKRVVKTLLRNGVDPHVRDNGGKYPLQFGLRGGGRDVPKRILSACALKDVAVDWPELRLAPEERRFCLVELFLCSEEVRLMKGTRVGASSVSYHDVVTRHVGWVAPRLPAVVPRDRLRRDFPHYANLISLRLRSAVEKRVATDCSRGCFSVLPPGLLPVPVTCSDVILRCLNVGDMRNFVRAVQPPSRKRSSRRSRSQTVRRSRPAALAVS